MDWLTWLSIVSLLINIVLIVYSWGLLVASRRDNEHKLAQIKIWMNAANGVCQALQRVISDKWNGYYSDKQDVINSVHAIHASAFSLYQSLYEERAVPETEYLKQQAEFRKAVTKNTISNQEELSADNTETPQESADKIAANNKNP